MVESGYFETLGVNALWISPLNRGPEGLWTGVEGGSPRYSSYHGYWPIAPREVDPRLGTSADVDALVAAAHARGIRVILDVVLNHVHAEHPYARERPDWLNPLCACGSAACPWQTHIRTCWFTRYLPDISWETSEALETQVEDAVWWLERFDLDGLRVDAVPMMPRFVTRHLTHEVHRRLEGLRTRQYLVGETYTGTNGIGDIRWSLGPDGLDGQFDFPVMWTLRQVFAWEDAPLWVLADVWQRTAAAWAGSTAVMGVFAGNHDVTRFLSEAAGQVDGAVYDQAWRAPPPIPDDADAYARLRLAQAFVLTVPGAPVLYYGDEFGLPGVGDPDNRRPMRFGGERTPLEQETAQTIGRLGRLRRCLPALRRGTWTLLRAEAERLSYLRDAGDGAPALVVLNRQPASAEVVLPVGAAGGPWREVLSGREVTAREGQIALTLAPRTPAVLVPAAHRCAWEGGE
ncbi:MAG: alpha-amylase family glycosyl hydrolase [bacterium]